MIPLFFINATLAVIWAAVSGTFTALNVAFGFVLGALALSLIRHQSGSTGYFLRTLRAFDLLVVFLYELVKSTISVATIVLTRRTSTLEPAIVAYPLAVTKDFEIVLLANLITLTPGTLSVDVSADRKTLFVHCIDAPDPKAVVASIRRSFEHRILGVFEG